MSNSVNTNSADRHDGRSKTGGSGSRRGSNNYRRENNNASQNMHSQRDDSRENGKKDVNDSDENDVVETSDNAAIPAGKSNEESGGNNAKQTDTTNSTENGKLTIQTKSGAVLNSLPKSSDPETKPKIEVEEAKSSHESLDKDVRSLIRNMNMRRSKGDHEWPLPNSIGYIEMLLLLKNDFEFTESKQGVRVVENAWISSTQKKQIDVLKPDSEEDIGNKIYLHFNTYTDDTCHWFVSYLTDKSVGDEIIRRRIEKFKDSLVYKIKEEPNSVDKFTEIFREFKSLTGQYAGINIYDSLKGKIIDDLIFNLENLEGVYFEAIDNFYLFYGNLLNEGVFSLDNKGEGEPLLRLIKFTKDNFSNYDKSVEYITLLYGMFKSISTSNVQKIFSFDIPGGSDGTYLSCLQGIIDSDKEGKRRSVLLSLINDVFNGEIPKQEKTNVNTDKDGQSQFLEVVRENYAKFVNEDPSGMWPFFASKRNDSEFVHDFFKAGLNYIGEEGSDDDKAINFALFLSYALRISYKKGNSDYVSVLRDFIKNDLGVLETDYPSIRSSIYYVITWLVSFGVLSDTNATNLMKMFTSSVVQPNEWEEHVKVMVSYYYRFGEMKLDTKDCSECERFDSNRVHIYTRIKDILSITDPFKHHDFKNGGKLENPRLHCMGRIGAYYNYFDTSPVKAREDIVKFERQINKACDLDVKDDKAKKAVRDQLNLLKEYVTSDPEYE